MRQPCFSGGDEWAPTRVHGVFLQVDKWQTFIGFHSFRRSACKSKHSASESVSVEACWLMRGTGSLPEGPPRGKEAWLLYNMDEDGDLTVGVFSGWWSVVYFLITLSRLANWFIAGRVQWMKSLMILWGFTLSFAHLPTGSVCHWVAESALWLFNLLSIFFPDPKMILLTLQCSPRDVRCAYDKKTEK